MIDKQVFANGMGLLAGAFSRTLDGAVSRAYYLVLGPHLNDAEFLRAVELTLASETYWPSPAVLLGKVKQDVNAKALTAFEHVTKVMGQHGGARFLPHATFQAEFDAPTRAGISAVGGLLEIQNTTAERWGTLKKKFADAYAASLSPQPQIAAPTTDPRVKELAASTARVLTLSGRDRAAGRDV